ncbi:hypothetical protein ACVWWK_000348 [Bradyrhizobium sp. LB9.1b]
MLLQLLVGALVGMTNIGIHALVTVVAVSIARRAGLRTTVRPRLHLMGVMIATAAVLTVAHTLEILVWAWTYGIVQAAAPGSDLLYFAFVNYTTLGYGDITPVREWRLIGPLTAMKRRAVVRLVGRHPVRSLAQDTRASRRDRSAGLQAVLTATATICHAAQNGARWLRLSEEEGASVVTKLSAFLLFALGLQIEVCELMAVQEHDLALGIADEAENAEFMQPRQGAGYCFQCQA